MTDQPGGSVLERGGEPRPRPGRGHRGDHHAVLATRHPQRLGLQEHLGGAQVQTPPTARGRAGVIARAAPLAARAPPRRGHLRPHPGHEHLLARPSVSRSTDSITVCSTPSTRRHTLVLRTPRLRLRLWSWNSRSEDSGVVRRPSPTPRSSPAGHSSSRRFGGAAHQVEQALACPQATAREGAARGSRGARSALAQRRCRRP